MRLVAPVNAHQLNYCFFCYLGEKLGSGEGRERESMRERERERGGNLYAYLCPLPDILLQSILASKLIEKSGTLLEVKQK